MQIIYLVMKKTLYLLFLILLCACTEQYDLPSGKSGAGNPFQRSEREAVDIAVDVFQSGTRTTRAAIVSKLSVEPMLSSRHHTRLGATTDVDTAYFIVNSGDNEGFAFISGDKRRTPLLAFSDSGSLSSKDFEENPGLAFFKEKCEGDVMLYDGEYPSENRQEGQSSDSTVYYNFRDRYLYRMDDADWGQGSPYNDMAYTRWGEKCPAGCVPTAIAQLLNFYHYPKAIKGYTFDWPLLSYHRSLHADYRPYFNKEVAMLFHKVGEVVKVNYYPTGSSTRTDSIKDRLRELGYKVLAEGPLDKSLDAVRDILPMMKQGRPTVMEGFLVNGGAGHMWLADGWATFTKVVTYKDRPFVRYVSKKSFKEFYIHMNWGWDGKNNGFFLSDIYDIQHQQTQYDNDRRISKSYNLGRYVRFWTFIPNR